MRLLAGCLLSFAISVPLLGGCRQKVVVVDAKIPAGDSKPAQDSAMVAPAAAGQFVGFDRNDYPGDGRLAELRKSFAYAGFWLTPPPGETTNSWVGKRRLLVEAGFGFLILANGRLEKQILKTSVTPDALGKADAMQAIAAASSEGFPKGAIIFLDQEEGGRLTDAQAAYFFGWTEAVGASEYRAGAYLSGQQVPDGTGQDGKVIYTTTAADVRERVAEAAKHGAKLKPVALWVYEDACPPAPGCVVARAPRLDESGTLGTVAWQYAQSPRRPAVTKSCAATYGADGLCYGGATKDIFVDLNVAASADPSQGR